MSAREAFKKLVDDAKDAWVDHTVTVAEAIKVCQDLAEAATTIKDPDAKECLVEAFGQVFDLAAAKYDMPGVPQFAETRIENYIKGQLQAGVGAWYDVAIGPAHAE